MAEILPKKLFGDVSPEVAKVFSRFRSLDDQYRIRWSFPGRSSNPPDFAIFYQDQYAFIVAVSSLSAPDAETLLAPRLSLFSEKQFTLDNFMAREQSALSVFLAGLNALGTSPAREGITCVILFPNVPQSLLNRIHRIDPSPFIWIGKESLVSDKLASTLKSLARKPASSGTLDAVRALFSPEIQIPKTILPKGSRPAGRDDTEPVLTRFLLDYDQEAAVKMDLALSPEAEKQMTAATPRLVTGVAGSGKTLVLLYRAGLVSKLDPTKRCLVLTHNKPLIQDLHRRLNEIIRDPAQKRRIECIHFANWCRKFFAADCRILAPFEREEWIRSSAEQVTKAADLPLRFLCDEIDWIESYDVRTLADYLRAKRVGRKRTLNDQQRRAVYSVLENYRQLLCNKNCLDWTRLSSLVWERVRSNQEKLRTYDYVFVDEAQFFAPVALKLIRSIVEPKAGQLMLAADPTQGFLKRRESWAASGLNVRGRTVRLTRPYRNSRSILQYAADFYRRRLPDEDEEINLPDDQQIAQLHDGPGPETITVRALQDEITRTCNEIREAVDRGANPADILIILSDERGRQRDRILASLNKGRLLVADAQRKVEANAARLCSINAMTGLEAPIVFILGSTDLLQIEESLKLAPEERKEIVRDNTRKLFTAMTRASQRLVVFKRR